MAVARPDSPPPTMATRRGRAALDPGTPYLPFEGLVTDVECHGSPRAAVSDTATMRLDDTGVSAPARLAADDVPRTLHGPRSNPLPAG